MTTYTATAGFLRAVLDVVEFASPESLGDEPASFLETMRITSVAGGVSLLCTDGFRAHEVVSNQGEIEGNSEEIVVPPAWLRQALRGALDTDKVVLTGSLSASNLWKVNVATGDDDESTEFRIEPWPSLSKLINDDLLLPEEEVGFNLRYFTDLVTGLNNWVEATETLLDSDADSDEDDEDDTDPDIIPVKLHSMRRRSVNHISYTTELGRVRFLLMPLIMSGD